MLKIFDQMTALHVIQPGLSREIPAWLCDAAVCAVISVGSARIAIDALTE
jgi:hypothetical protein